jgi:hypothetical protein
MIPSHKRSDQPQAIGEAFLQEGSLISILGQIEDRQKIQASLYEALEMLELGHFAPEISLGGISQAGDIKLLTKYATIVSKLKNKLPSLLHYLRESGCQIKGISLRVSPSAMSPAINAEPPKKDSPVMSPAAKEAWRSLLTKTEPGSTVHNAIVQLLKNNPSV